MHLSNQVVRKSFSAYQRQSMELLQIKAFGKSLKQIMMNFCIYNLEMRDTQIMTRNWFFEG